MIGQLYRSLEKKTPPGLKRLIPQSWRIWAGYQIKVAWQQQSSQPPVAAHFRVAPPLSLPKGETEESIHAYLSQFYIQEDGAMAERGIYLQVAFRRFLYTLQITPDQPGQTLEIGANPYFISLLLLRFKPCKMIFVNFFGAGFKRGKQTLVGPQQAAIPIEYDNINLETEGLPYADGSFDTVLLCEVFEHLTNDPYQALLEIKRVLKPQGVLVLTTPNVLRMENVAHLIAGKNVYDDYSAYGPYGRHNREYTVEELKKLFEQAGFAINQVFTADSHPEAPYAASAQPVIEQIKRDQSIERGQYIFIQASNERAAEPKKPRWLYRSYPESEVNES